MLKLVCWDIKTLYLSMTVTKIIMVHICPINHQNIDRTKVMVSTTTHIFHFVSDVFVQYCSDLHCWVSLFRFMVIMAIWVIKGVAQCFIFQHIRNIKGFVKKNKGEDDTGFSIWTITFYVKLVSVFISLTFLMASVSQKAFKIGPTNLSCFTFRIKFWVSTRPLFYFVLAQFRRMMNCPVFLFPFAFEEKYFSSKYLYRLRTYMLCLQNLTRERGENCAQLQKNSNCFAR